MKAKQMLSVLAALAMSYSLHAQIGINTTNPDSTAALHIYHNSKGVLLPTVNAGSRSTIVSNNAEVGDGLLVYDTDQKLYYCRNSTDKKWLVLNPWRVSEEEDLGWANVRLAEFYKGRNVYIGENSAAQAAAKLHVEGTVMIDDAVTAKNGMTVTGVATVSSTFTVGTGTATTTISDNNISSGTVTSTNFVGYGIIPLGGIIMWSGTTTPDGWALCNGQSSNGYTTPDLRGRFIVGYGANGTGVPSDVWDSNYNRPGNLSAKGASTGNTGGEKSHTLTIAEMPSHMHAYTDDVNVRGKFPAIEAGFPKVSGGSDSGSSADGVGAGSVYNTQSVGGSQAHENRPPYYVLAFVMRVK
jgi:microcystin-dependent protein